MRKLLYVMFILFLTVSCSSKRQIVEVPVEVIHTEYVHDITVDSVYIKDSIDRWRSGDTLYIYKEYTKYKYLIKVDTVLRTDTIPQIIKEETVKEVEVNHIRWYQKVLMWMGAISLILAGLIIYKLRN